MESYEFQTSAVENPPQTSSNQPRHQRLWLWLLLVLLLGGGFALWRVFNPGSEPSAPATTQGPPPRPIETVTLTQGDGIRLVRLLGQVEASERTTVRTQTAGLVQQVLVQPGDSVRSGMIIAVLDDADQRLAVTEAQAQLAQQRSELARLEVGTRREIIAQRQAELRSTQARQQEAEDNFRRTSELVAAGALSRRTLVQARAAADAARGERLQAEASLAEATAGPTREEIDAQRANMAAAAAALNQARLALQRTQITSLSDGIVQQREVSVGGLVQSGDSVVTLVNSSELDLFLELPEELSGSVTSGLPVTLTARALPNWRASATITAVLPAAEAASRRQRVRVRLNKPPQDLLPGMAIQGELQLQAAFRKGGLQSQPYVVPRDTLIRQGEKWLIYTVANNKAKQVEVELIADMGENMAIYNEQLQAGQPVVVRGGDALADGATVVETRRLSR